MDPRLQILLKNRCYFGTSSWKYPGWKGMIYQKPYTTEKEFKDSCLKEYADHYPCVGVDHTYYSWPTAKSFSTYTEQTPEHFRFLLKATEKVTIFKYPALPRYAKEAGKLNDTFLNAELFQEKFLLPLLPYKDRIGPIMFEFSQFHQGTLSRGSEFVERLNNFLKEITKNTGFKFAIEIRNSNWLQPAYFECLVNHQVGHVFNSWSRMPVIGEQFDKAQNYSLPFFIGRLLLKPGILYQEAVDSFAPYDKLHQELTPIRDSVVKLLLLAQTRNIDSYILVNNRFEGCAPKTIEGILKGLPTTDLKGQ